MVQFPLDGQIAGKIMPRPRLLHLLERLPPGGIAWLRAPAGYGKTELLLQYAQYCVKKGKNAVWGHGKLPRNVAAAIPDLLILDAMGRNQTESINALLQSPAIKANAHIRIVIASRQRLALDLTAWRLQNLTVEIGAEELSLKESECDDLMQAMDLLPDKAKSWKPQLSGWIEVWVKLCELLNTHQGSDQPALAQLLGCCDSLLRERIGGDLSDQAIRFLIATSVPDRFDEELAAQLTGVSASARVVQDLEAAGVPLVSIPGNRKAWHYHPIYRHYLHARARREKIDFRPFHEIVFRHLNSRGRGHLAVQHALTAHQGDEAVDLVEMSGGWRLVMKGVSSDLQSALGTIRENHVESHPNASLAQAFMLAKQGATRQSRALLAKIKCTHSNTSAALDCDITLVDTHIGIYEDRAMDEADENRLHAVIRALEPEDVIGRALAMNHLCTISLHLGEFSLSQQYAESAMHFYEQADALFGALHLHAHLGQMRIARGDLDGAEREYQLMQERAQALPGVPDKLVAIAKALRSGIAYETNDIERSRMLLSEAIRYMEGSDSDAWLDVLAVTYGVSARLAFIQSSLPGALSALAHAEQIAGERDMPRLRRLIRIERVQALTLSYELGQAGSEIRKMGLLDQPHRILNTAEVDWAMHRGSAVATLTRYLVYSRQCKKALSMLALAEEQAMRGGQLLAVAKLRIIRSMALWQLKQKEASQAVLCDAVRLLGRQPFRRLVLDEGPLLLEIIQATLDHGRIKGALAGQIRKKLIELNHLSTIDGMGAGHGLSHSVSAQLQRSAARTENALLRQYLQLIALGLSNKEIARTLGVSPNTVKYHLKTIFRDLRVDSRSRAVFRARELGLII